MNSSSMAEVLWISAAVPSLFSRTMIGCLHLRRRGVPPVHPGNNSRRKMQYQG
ncbi:hypothetical protein N9219_01350 [bacterium]|nr:hypothetical protein [bacterium]